MELGQRVIPIGKSVGCHFKESSIFDDLAECSTCTIVKIYPDGIVELESFRGNRDLFTTHDLWRADIIEQRE